MDNNCSKCHTCYLIKKRYEKLYEKYKYLKNKQNNMSTFESVDYFDGLTFLFDNNNKKLEKIKNTDIENTDIGLKRIKKNYYSYYNSLYPEDNKNNINVNTIYKNVNKYNNDKKLININVIYEWYKLYNFYIKETIEINKNITFDEYVNYNKNRFKYIEKIYRFKNKVYKCYLFVVEIQKHISNFLENDDLIDILKKCNLSYSKIYKLKHVDMKNLIDFIIDKYNIYTEEVFTAVKEPKHIFTPILNPEKVKLSTVLKYPGNKTNLLKQYGHTFNLKGKDCFIDMFGGSLSISSYVRNINKDIKIIAFDSNEHLIRFYEVLRDNYQELIDNIETYLSYIKAYPTIDDKIVFIKNLVSLINNESFNQPVLKSAIFYILNKISFNVMKYTKDGLLRIDIDKKKLPNLNIKIDKLLAFSNFLKTITIIKHDFIKNGFDIINKYIISEKSFIYIDPPYDTDYNDYTNYSTPFNRNHQDEILKIVNNLSCKYINCLISNRNTEYIRNLYKKYNIIEIDIPPMVSNCKPRKEFLIYNY